MEARRETRSSRPVSPESGRVREACFTFSRYKLTADELSILTRLPVATVERVMGELRRKSELPLQYLDHQLS
jgi:hypothetical protein